jgi:hypothetical protein
MGTDNYTTSNDNSDDKVRNAKQLWEIDGEYFPLDDHDSLTLGAYRLLLLGNKRRLRSMEKQAQKGQLHPEVERMLKLLAASQARNGKIDPEIRRILDLLASFKAGEPERQRNPWAVGFFIMTGFAVVFWGITIRQQETIARLEYLSNHPMLNFQSRPSTNGQGH